MLKLSIHCFLFVVTCIPQVSLALPEFIDYLKGY